MVDQERQLHDEAVYAYGEASMFILLWTIDDYEANLVGRCPWCFLRGGIEEDVAKVYNQPAIAKCEYCYGTSFWDESATQLNGLKARIVRPAMWEATDETHKLVAQGDVANSVASLQSISDFRCRSGDFVLKADGTRWRIQDRATDNIISGYQASNDVRTMIGYVYPEVIREDESSVAFLIPPDVDTQKTILDISPYPNYPVDMSAYEVINGNLIGDSFASDAELGF